VAFLVVDLPLLLLVSVVSNSIMALAPCKRIILFVRCEIEIPRNGSIFGAREDERWSVVDSTQIGGDGSAHFAVR